MRILLIGAGGVGSAVVAIAARRDFFDALVVADFDQGKAQRAIDAVATTRGADPRISAAQLDASSSYWPFLGSILLLGLGMGCSFVPLTMTAVNGVAPHETGLASALLNR